MATRTEAMRGARRGRRLRVAVSAFVVMLILIAAGLVLTDTLRLPYGPEPVIAPTMAGDEEDPE